MAYILHWYELPLCFCEGINNADYILLKTVKKHNTPVSFDAGRWHEFARFFVAVYSLRMASSGIVGSCVLYIRFVAFL